MELSVGHSLLAGVAVAAVLAVGHLLVPRLERLPVVPEGRVESLAGGISVAFVFLHLLPELSRGHERLGGELDGPWPANPLSELGIFVLALVGFVGLYGLEHLAATVGRHREAHLFVVHLVSFAAFNAVVAYTLPLQLRVDAVLGGLFAVAIVVHLLLVDRTLQHHWPERHPTRGRHVLVAGIAVGTVAAVVVPEPPGVVRPTLWAVVGGMILLNGLKDELPGARRSSFPWFLAGVVLYAAVAAASLAGDPQPDGAPGAGG